MSDTGTFPDLQSLVDSVDAGAPAVPSDLQPAAAPSQVTFGTQNLQPPTPLYVTQSDTLQLNVWNHVAGIEVDVTGRVLLPDGTIQRIFQPVFPTNNRAINTKNITMPQGFLLDISINSPSSAVARGQCFGQVVLVRGASAALSAVQLLCQDYVATGLAMQWPGGLIRSPIEGPGFIVSQVQTVGAGVDFQFGVPTNTRWKIRSLSAVLTTSATVATRQVTFSLKDSVGNTYCAVPFNGTQTASVSQRYNAFPGSAFTAAIISILNVPLPTDTVLFTNMAIYSSTSNLQAGDAWSNITMSVEEWIEPQ